MRLPLVASLSLLAIAGLAARATMAGSSNRAGQPPGIKITTRMRTVVQVSADWGEPALQTTEYFQGDRSRTEYRSPSGHQALFSNRTVFTDGPRLATITRCDRDEVYQLNLDDGEYSVVPTPRRRLSRTQGAPDDRPPTILIETATSDTGERKKMFGLEARHVIATRKESPLTENAGVTPNETVSDGWYTDLDTTIPCDPASGHRGHAFVYLVAYTLADPDHPPLPPKVTFKDTGARETGFPLVLRSTTRSKWSLPDGTVKDSVSTSERRVTDLSIGPLDPALFEVPPGFRHVSAVRTSPPVPLWIQVRDAWQRAMNWIRQAL